MLREHRVLTHSQNFISDPKLVIELLNKSDISISDLVLDIGAGKGIITEHLASKCNKVIAVEIDKALYQQLINRFSNNPKVKLFNTDILKIQLPRKPYKVFSNIPFNYTSRIINMLYFQNNSPVSTYIIMQEEAIELLLGKPRETLRSLLLKPFFSIKYSYQFNQYDFKPTPSVNIGMICIKKYENPAIEEYLKPEYYDFIVYGTTQCKKTLKKALKKIFTFSQLVRLAKDLEFSLKAKPLDLSVYQWINLFKFFKENATTYEKNLVAGSYAYYMSEQEKQPKVYRTRSHSFTRKKC